MVVTQITVSAGRKLPHPTEDYANLSEMVSVTAGIEPGDDVAMCTRALQQQAEAMVEHSLERLIARTRMKEQLERNNTHARQATESKAAMLAAKHGKGGSN